MSNQAEKYMDSYNYSHYNTHTHKWCVNKVKPKMEKKCDAHYVQKKARVNRKIKWRQQILLWNWNRIMKKLYRKMMPRLVILWLQWFKTIFIFTSATVLFSFPSVFIYFPTLSSLSVDLCIHTKWKKFKIYIYDEGSSNFYSYMLWIWSNGKW